MPSSSHSAEATQASALVGSTGFVGATLLRQRPFGQLYRSTNIGDIEGHSFDLVVCAGAPAQKWIANREPEADRANLEGLMRHLRRTRCKRLVLISTVDVFADSTGADEDTPVEEQGLHAYGRHRLMLERAVQEHFAEHLIVRLPGLVGPGLRKNVIFDFLNDNNLGSIDSRSVYQFYPMVNLWPDIETALAAGLRLVHLTAEPVSVAAVAREGFGRDFTNTLAGSAAAYDMQSRHAALYAANGRYQYTARDVMLAIRAYAQSEARSLPPAR